MPVFVSPFAYDLAIHPDGYRAVAEAVETAGVTSILSESTSTSLEEIAPGFGSQRGFVQISLIGADDRHALRYIERIAAAGYRGVCLTDIPSRFWRERLLESGASLNADWGMGNYGEGLADPGVHRAHAAFETERWDWGRFERFVARLELPWMLKGVLTRHDARRAVDLGAAAVYVSNFGARNLDGMPPTIGRLAEIVDEVDGRVPVIVDSGFRRGTDVAKALALGASAVGVGRLAAVALAAGGMQAVLAMLELLREELAAAVGVLGASDLSGLDRTLLEPAFGGGASWLRQTPGSFAAPNSAFPLV
jgi:4-hydroxymandelate oxidase